MGEFVIKNSLTKIEARNFVKNLMNENVTRNDITKNQDETEEIVKKDLTSYERELYLLDKALMKSITIMKSTLVSFDDVINSVDYNWILKELLMQYRLIIHGDIDTFLKLRKRLKSKMPLNYLSSSRNSKKSYNKVGDHLDKEIVTPIHLGTTFLS